MGFIICTVWSSVEIKPTWQNKSWSMFLLIRFNRILHSCGAVIETDRVWKAHRSDKTRDIYELQHAFLRDLSVIFPISKFPPENWELEFSAGARRCQALGHLLTAVGKGAGICTQTSELSHGNSFPAFKRNKTVFKLDPEPQT